MSLLKEPINRGVYDFIIRSPHVVSLFDRYCPNDILFIICAVEFNGNCLDIVVGNYLQHTEF